MSHFYEILNSDLDRMISNNFGKFFERPKYAILAITSLIHLQFENLKKPLKIHTFTYSFYFFSHQNRSKNTKVKTILK